MNESSKIECERIASINNWAKGAMSPDDRATEFEFHVLCLFGYVLSLNVGFDAALFFLLLSSAFAYGAVLFFVVGTLSFIERLDIHRIPIAGISWVKTSSGRLALSVLLVCGYSTCWFGIVASTL